MKPSFGASWGLVLLCTLHACAPDYVPTEKSGSCPQPPSYPTCEGLGEKPKNGCSTDQQCPRQEKCCYYGCSFQCKQPLEEKLGSCQDYDRARCVTVRPLPNECESDNQCPGNRRCCCRNCRKACSETVKSGICPPIKAKCSVPLPKEKCENDSKCPGRQKCCSMCGDKCTDPEPENPGICPVDPEIENNCGFLLPPLCSRDADCASNEKCCHFGCRIHCVKALAAKPGVCPNIKAKCKVPLDKDQCQNDSICPNNEKCCPLCGKKCRAPEPVHDGFCPAPKPVKCDAKYISECSRDSGCKDDEKCCDVGCRMACVKSLPEKTGFCPFVRMDDYAKEMCNKCNNDKDCPAKEKCCTGAKGLECQDPDNGIVKAGKCPPLISWCDYPPPYLHQCNHDGNCLGGKKCCVQICTRECLDAVQVKPHPGTCPPDNIRCSKAEDAQCQGDSECKEDEKCCHNHCGLKCVPALPVKPHPGTCPPDNILCIKAEDDQCQSDSECKKDEKCCHNRCGLKCVPALPEKPGECPIVKIRCLLDPLPRFCNSDGDCLNAQKCCTLACSIGCTEPAHSGSCPVYPFRIGIVCTKNITKVDCTDDSACASDQKCCKVPVCTTKCVTAVPVKPKPGVCPKDKIVCIQKEDDRCKADSDCKGDQKCCYNRCGMKCLDAVKDKPGECPVPTTLCARVTPSKATAPNCTYDSDCPGAKKCCIPLCSKACTDPIVPVKSGKCPRDDVLCKRPEPDECQKDGDCPAKERCCYFHCGLKCKTPETDSPKPGMCPPDPIKCSEPAADQCKCDSECKGSDKCCHSHCGLKCVPAAPVPEKNGSCPLPPSFPTCKTFPTKPKDECDADLQCPGKEKCCEYGCSRQCKKPLQDKLGSCPDFNRTICLYARPAPAECTDDFQCPGTQRCCCYGNCRMECAETVREKRGVCPSAFTKCQYPLPDAKCADDTGCPGKKKCCFQCGWKCISPAENPGFCPAELGKEAQCGYQRPPQCSSDSDCALNEKCCMFGCGVQCVKALPAKPGMCPAIMARCILPLPKSECESDEGCSANKKCCQLCGNKCLDAVPDREGVCPSYNIMPMPCPTGSNPSCNHDWNCEADEKCCNVGCQRECVKALKEKMGFCPKTVEYTDSGARCDKCNTDKDCPGSDRCCAGVKGRECIPPLMYIGLPPLNTPATKG